MSPISNEHKTGGLGYHLSIWRVQRYTFILRGAGRGEGLSATGFKEGAIKLRELPLSFALSKPKIKHAFFQ
jgi:hypothetical protein